MKKFLAEFIGTFCLVLFGCGAAVISGHGPEGTTLQGLGLLGISLAFGLSVVVMAYAIGPVSGCHINPAISVAMLVAGRISAKDAASYIIAQVLGAILASAVLCTILCSRNASTLGEWALGSNGWGEGYLGAYPVEAAFITEFIMTFLFLFVIFATTDRLADPGMAGLAIGLTLVLIHLFAIPVTGTSVNPARSLAPALIAGGKALSQVWLFIVAPVLGGIAAALAWKVLFAEKG